MLVGLSSRAMAWKYEISTQLAITSTRTLSPARTWAFHRHGLAALLIGRFLAFVRTLLPTIAGLAGLNNTRFQIFNWLSGLLWVGILTTLGYILGNSPLFRQYEHHLMNILMLLPVFLLVIGLIGSIWVVIKRKKRKRKIYQII